MSQPAIVPRPSFDAILTRVRGEFLEMPGLRLTAPQACRLWGLDAPTCATVLGALVEGTFLFRTRDGSYMRLDYPLSATSRSEGPQPGRKTA